MIFKIKTAEFLNLVNNVKPLITEFKLLIRENGLKVNEIDKSYICLLDITLKKELIDIFNYSKNIDITLNSDNLYKILKDNKKTKVEFSLKSDNEDNDKLGLFDKAVFEFDNGFINELPLIQNVESDLPNTDGLEFKTKFFMSSKKFKEIAKNISNVSDAIIFNSNGNFMSFSSDTENNKSSIILNGNEINYINKIDSNSKYPIEYINHLVKSPISDNVKIEFSSQFPLKLSYEKPYFNVSYILAPRVSCD